MDDSGKRLGTRQVINLFLKIHDSAISTPVLYQIEWVSPVLTQLDTHAFVNRPSLFIYFLSV